MTRDISDLLKRDGQKLKTTLRHGRFTKLEKAQVIRHMGFVDPVPSGLGRD